MKKIISNKWKYKISIQDQFNDDSSQEHIEELCTSLIEQLQKVESEVEKGNIVEDEKDNVLSELSNVSSNFEFLRDLCSGEIEEDEWDNYSFEGDFEEMFNGYMDELYDLGDTRVSCSNGVIEKFMWVG